MTAPKGNKFAAKPAKARADANLNIRCKAADRGRWHKAAAKAGSKTSEWVVSTLNSAADKLLK